MVFTKQIRGNSLKRSLKQENESSNTKQNSKTVKLIKEVKISARMNKREFFTKMAPVAKEATRKNKIKNLYNNIRMQTNKFKWSNRPVKGKDGNAL